MRAEGIGGTAARIGGVESLENAKPDRGHRQNDRGDDRITRREHGRSLARGGGPLRALRRQTA